MGKSAFTCAAARRGFVRFVVALGLATGAAWSQEVYARPPDVAAAGAEAEAGDATEATDATRAADRIALQEWQLEFGIALEAHLRRQAARGDARDLLGAALLMPVVEGWRNVDDPAAAPASAASGDWFRAAGAVQPRDPLVAWLQASGCRPHWPDCDPAKALAFLLETAGDDMTVQLMAVADAVRRNDTAAVDAHLHAAAAASRHWLPQSELAHLWAGQAGDVHAPSMTSEVADALGRLYGLNRPAAAADAYGVPVVAVWAALPWPAYAPLTRLCDAATPSPATRRDDCVRVMARLAGSPVMADALIGTLRSVRLAGDGADAPAWRERLRRLVWLQESATRLLSVQSAAPLPADYFERFLREGEMAALEDVLRANGLPAQPPAGWLPDDPRLRGLVVEGHEPANPS